MELAHDRTPMRGTKPAHAAPTPRRIVLVDDRSNVAKRGKEPAAGYFAQLPGGDLSAATLAAVQKAAELVIVSEERRAAALRGEPVDPLAQ
jgi:hypothetical protein